jgi:hypothetical protein
MPRLMHSLELATSGRATCRGCGHKIAAATLRLGESVPNTFADDGGMTTHWYHPVCGALRRPEAFLAALSESQNGGAEAPPHGGAPPYDGAPPYEPPRGTQPAEVDESGVLRAEAEAGVAHHRLPRVNTASLAPTGRATCRNCKALIDKGSWRIALVYYEEGRFSPSGFIHAACAGAYLESTDILWRIRHWSPGLTPDELADLAAAIR